MIDNVISLSSASRSDGAAGGEFELDELMRVFILFCARGWSREKLFDFSVALQHQRSGVALFLSPSHGAKW